MKATQHEVDRLVRLVTVTVVPAQSFHQKFKPNFHDLLTTLTIIPECSNQPAVLNMVSVATDNKN